MKNPPIISRAFALAFVALAVLSPAFAGPGRDRGQEAPASVQVPAARVVSRIKDANPAGSFVAEHGRLSVEGPALMDEKGRPIQLRGMSAFWINWGEGGKFVNREAIDHLVKDWGITVYRVAVGVEPKGAYISNPDAMIALATAAIDACIENGIYVIIDWHAHDALPYGEQEAAFFRGIADAYGKYPNVIYEIWNEPVHVSWKSQIKPFAEDLIRNAIRPVDPHNIILIGSSSWSQDVDDCARDPINEPNLMYALHFYAGTHGEGLRRKAETAIAAGLPIFVSEWGTSASDGGANGQIYPEASDTWIAWMNKRGLSWVNWSVSDKAESSAALKPGTAGSGGWSDDALTPSGLYVRERIREGR
jgi:endoglucanase